MFHIQIYLESKAHQVRIGTQGSLKSLRRLYFYEILIVYHWVRKYRILISDLLIIFYSLEITIFNQNLYNRWKINTIMRKLSLTFGLNYSMYEIAETYSIDIIIIDVRLIDIKNIK